MNALFNHLWQSTLFAGAVALAALALRKNAPRIRYWLWLGASVKFLIPLSLLVWTGSRIELPPDSPSLRATTVNQVSNYFAPVSLQPATPTRPGFPWLLVLGAIWLFGISFLIIRWFRHWRTIRNIAKQGTKFAVRFPVPALLSRSEMEPGVFGIFRPVLLIPERLADQLSPKQLDAVLAHESRHVLCRDNLTAAVHMCVETLFWFHPLVWWIGARLMDERERDCDEAVLRQGSLRRDYAQGIVNVCKTYAESPLSCTAGIGGSDLKKRIRGIMTWRASLPMTARGRVTLAAAGFLAFALPLLIGIVRAQSLPPQPKYSYEAVSVHKTAPGQTRVHIGPGPQGGLETTGTSVMSLLDFAYDVRAYQVVDGPAWISSERYDVIFTPDKAERGTENGGTREDRNAYAKRTQQRLQAVLRDRFGLVLRSEQRTMPIYALMPAKGGAKMASTDPAQQSDMQVDNGRLAAKAASIKMLTTMLSSALSQPVIDETGLNGAYSFTLHWQPDSAAPSDPDGPSIFTALREQLGLRLEARRGPAQVYVIEKIERPSDN